MNSVVATQREGLGELASLVRKFRVDGYPGELAVDRLELGDRALVRGRREASLTSRRRERCAALGVGEDARRGGILARPQLIRDAGPVLGDDELDERRGVEVEDQRRCSATSSDTDPRALTFAGGRVRGPAGGVTRPRLTSS